MKSDIRNALHFKLLRDRLRQYILDEIKTRHVPMSEITVKAQNMRPYEEKQRHRVSSTVICEIVKELESEQKVTRYLDGNITRVAPSQRNELDVLFAPLPKLKGTAHHYEMEDFGHKHGGLGRYVGRGIGSTFGDAYGWEGAW